MHAHPLVPVPARPHGRRRLSAIAVAAVALTLSACTPAVPRSPLVDRATPAPIPTLTGPTVSATPFTPDVDDAPTSTPLPSEAEPEPTAHRSVPASSAPRPDTPATPPQAPSAPVRPAARQAETGASETPASPRSGVPAAPTPASGSPSRGSQAARQRPAPQPSPTGAAGGSPTSSTPASRPSGAAPTSGALTPTRAALTLVSDDAIADVTRQATSWYKTSGPTRFYADSSSGPQAVVIPRQYVLGARDAAVEGSRVRVDYRGVSGWVDLGDVKQVDKTTVGATLDSYTDQEYAAVLQSQVAAFCPDVRYDVSASPDRAGQYNASHSAVFSTVDGVKTATSSIAINFGRKDLPDPEFSLVRSINSHECGHVVQFRVYPPDPQTGALNGGLGEVSEKYWGGTDKPGEHFADCIADQMGASRSGESWNTSGRWISGYGRECSPTQADVARRVLAGERVS